MAKSRKLSRPDCDTEPHFFRLRCLWLPPGRTYHLAMRGKFLVSSLFSQTPWAFVARGLKHGFRPGSDRLLPTCGIPCCGEPAGCGRGTTRSASARCDQRGGCQF